jgi:hypothetical protein
VAPQKGGRAGGVGIDLAECVDPCSEAWRDRIQRAEIVVEEPDRPAVFRLRIEPSAVEAEQVAGLVSRKGDELTGQIIFTRGQRVLCHFGRRVHVAETVEIQLLIDNRSKKVDGRTRQAKPYYALPIIVGEPNR